MTIEFDTILKYLLLGLTVGWLCGMFVAQYSIDFIAKRYHDALVLRRREAIDRNLEHTNRPPKGTN